MPGTIIREKTARVARSFPTDTGVWFLAGLSEKGVVGEPEEAKNITEWEKNFGGRVSYSSAWDMVDGFFRRGGNKVIFSRAVGVTPVKAFVMLKDGSAADTLKIEAKSYGDWANTRNVAVVAGDGGGQFKIVFTDDVDTSYTETSPSFTAVSDAVTWLSVHDDYRGVPQASALDPAIAAAASLAGGTDDHATVSDSTSQAALDAMGPELGPGQVSYANRTTPTAHGQLATHAELHNRRALYDPPNTTSKATLLTTAQGVTGLSNGRYGALFAPWVDIGGIANGPAARPVPPSCVVAAAIASNDGFDVSPNQPSAGDFGLLDSVSDILATFSKADQDDLNAASCNLIIRKAGDIKIYGYRAGVLKSANPNWWQFGNSRLYMAIAARADNILERFVLRQIDGRHIVFKDLEGQLKGMLIPYYNAGSLYGEEPEDAFFVDTGVQVNTEETIANGEIHAVIELTMSSMGETVTLDIVKRQISA